MLYLTKKKKRGIEMAEIFFNEGDEYDVITLSFEDGEDEDFIVLAIFDVQDYTGDYVALMSVKDVESESDDSSVYIYHYSEGEDGEPIIDEITDEIELNIVSEAFEQILDEEDED